MLCTGRTLVANFTAPDLAWTRQPGFPLGARGKHPHRMDYVFSRSKHVCAETLEPSTACHQPQCLEVVPKMAVAIQVRVSKYVRCLSNRFAQR